MIAFSFACVNTKRRPTNFEPFQVFFIQSPKVFPIKILFIFALIHAFYAFFSSIAKLENKMIRTSIFFRFFGNFG